MHLPKWTGGTIDLGEHEDLRVALAAAAKSGADLSGADLSGADLRRAVLSGADLSGADLSGADLRRADLSGAVLSGAVLSGAVLRRAVGLPPAPVVPDIDAAILAQVESGAGRLDMEAWHTCDTTHCRAGWAIVLAGDAGRDLERLVGSSLAGHLIYRASRPGVQPPDFHCSTEEALADLRACAAAAGPAAAPPD